MTFPYPIDTTIPATNNFPGNDQPGMKTNFANINGYLTVDHVEPGTNPGAGFHEQVTIFGNNSQSAPTGQNSVIYTILGTADNTHNQLIWQNSQFIAPLSGVKCFANVSVTYPGSVATATITNGYNLTVASITNGSPVTLNLTTATGAISGNNVCVLLYEGINDATLTYTYTNPTLAITFARASGGSPVARNINVIVLQF